MNGLTVAEPKKESESWQGTAWAERARSAARLLNHSFSNASAQFSHLEMARQRAAVIRWKSIENLDKYLIEFESNFIRSGGKVLWAQDISDALDSILDILKKAGVSEVIKSKTNTAQEIGLNNFLSAQGIKSIETDTGDFIVQKAGEESSHMVMPALHKPLSEIAKLISEELQEEETDDPEVMVKLIRSHLRPAFLKAGAGITGCNFIVADPGAIVIMENEGNAQLTASLPKIHIVIAGVDKILPSLNDLDLFLPLLATYGTGQTMTAFNSIITGPKQADEMDGPEELYVVLLDNGRSDVLEHEHQRQAMSCIRCGACQTSCPVYNTAGPGEFPSPVAAVTLPLQGGQSEFRALSQASTLCGACKDVCPVKIDIPRLLLENRRLYNEKGYGTRADRWFYFAWKKAMLKREIMSWTGIKARKHIMENLFSSQKGLRKMPRTSGKSFNEWYREKMNYK